MEINKETLGELRKDPLMHLIANLFGTNLDELVESAKKELEEKENVEQIEKRTKEIVNAMQNKEKEELDNKMNLASLEEALKQAGFKNFKLEDVTPKKEYEAPKCEGRSFIMTKQQFVEFVNKYTELVNNFKKLSYLFGISFDFGGAKFSFEKAVATIIWDFVRIIFGDDSSEDIADFIYGNSNFDSPEQLYDELI